jgi:carbon storage regulator
MLVLTRTIGGKILVGDDIELVVIDIKGDSVRLGIDAPRHVRIQREEVARLVESGNRASADTSEDELAQAVRSLRPRA